LLEQPKLGPEVIGLIRQMAAGELARGSTPIPSETKKFTGAGTVRSLPILAGLHHDCPAAA
jgi:hypothetical protein